MAKNARTASVFFVSRAGLEPSTLAEDAQGPHHGIPAEDGRLEARDEDARHEVETEKGGGVLVLLGVARPTGIGGLQQPLIVSSAALQSVAFSPDGRHIAVTSLDGILWVVTLEHG
ncbi:MAG: WD40 repeat domain-containing protein [Actinomycetota bacterium]